MNKSIQEELGTDENQSSLPMWPEVRRSFGTVLEESMECACHQEKPRYSGLNDRKKWTGHKYIELKSLVVDKKQ